MTNLLNYILGTNSGYHGWTIDYFPLMKNLPKVILGILFGTVWVTIFWSAGKKDLLFYNELASNNVVCNKPSKQTFKCSVYKNGEIISSDVV